MTSQTGNRPDTPRLGVLLAGLAPCAFCGISAVLLLFASIFFGPPPTPGILAGAFCALSGAFGLWLGVRARDFLALPRRHQMRIVVTAWAMHVIAGIALGTYAWIASL